MKVSEYMDMAASLARPIQRPADGMLGNAVPPTSSTVTNAGWGEERQVFGSGMSEPEEMVSPEQKALALELRMMATQVECERLAEAAKKAHKAALKAKAAMRKRIVYQSGRPSNNQRISMSVRLDDAKELLAWMELVSRYNLKLPPKSVVKFRQALAKRLAREPPPPDQQGA